MEQRTCHEAVNKKLKFGYAQLQLTTLFVSHPYIIRP